MTDYRYACPASGGCPCGAAVFASNGFEWTLRCTGGHETTVSGRPRELYPAVAP